MEALSFSWSLMAEGIFLEWGIMLIGVCSYTTQHLVLNPSRLEINEYGGDAAEFYANHSTGILLCDSFEDAEMVSKGLTEKDTILAILNKLLAGVFLSSTLRCCGILVVAFTYNLTSFLPLFRPPPPSLPLPRYVSLAFNLPLCVYLLSLLPFPPSPPSPLFFCLSYTYNYPMIFNQICNH